MKMQYKPIVTDQYQPITHQSDKAFLFLIQRALLLGMKEDGLLNEIQYRHAEALLSRQYPAESRMIPYD